MQHKAALAHAIKSDVQYRGRLEYALKSDRVEPGMDVPYKKYLKSAIRPVAEYLYPIYEYDKFTLEFVVTAQTPQKAAAKILAQKDVQKVFGKKATANEWHKMDNSIFFDIETDNEDVGKVTRSLVITEFAPEEQAQVIFIQ
jgi:hypothetical protein